MGRITKNAYKVLDAFGEDNILAVYLKCRSVDAMLERIEEDTGPISVGSFYRWLRSDKTGERWKRWLDNKKIIGASAVEEALMIADDANDGSVQAARLRVETRWRTAQVYDRQAFGKPDAGTTVNVVSLQHDYNEALKKVEEEFKEEEIEEADYEVLEDPEEEEV